MEPLVLTRISPGEYRVDDALLIIAKIRGQGATASRSGWEVLSLLSGDAWTERNQSIFTTTFPRLRDARAYLDAVLASDPPPKRMRVQKLQVASRIKRGSAGEHTVISHHPDGTILKGLLRKGTRYWLLTDRQGTSLRQYRTLREAASWAGADMHACPSHDWS